MSLPSIFVLARSVREPTSLLSLSVGEWDLLIRQGRNADLLGLIAAQCDATGVLDLVPAGPKMHLVSALNMALRQQIEVRREVQHIHRALVAAKVPLVLLKGAAYVVAGLPAGRGRLVSDVDILVPQDSLNEVESALMIHGWQSDGHSDYDQRYYRKWMHELPPMRHFKRGTSIDVHHAILPLTARLRPSSNKLLQAARPIGSNPEVKVLAPVDMVLHSATHLFHEGELQLGLRGLADLDRLLRDFGSSNGFWDCLVPRAVELELSRPLFYALRYARFLLSTPIPEAVLRSSAEAPGGRRNGLALAAMDALFLRALRPAHVTCSDRWTPLARSTLYLRGHWLRMPPLLLARHLGHQAFVALRPLPTE